MQGLSVELDLDRAFKEAAAELRQDERQALLRVAAATATRVDAELLAHALGHHDLFPQLAEERPVTPEQEEVE